MELETRKCKCGCKRTWRCLPSSPDEYYSVYECKGQLPGVRRLEFGDQAPREERRTRRAKSRWDGGRR